MIQIPPEATVVCPLLVKPTRGMTDNTVMSN